MATHDCLYVQTLVGESESWQGRIEYPVARKRRGGEEDVGEEGEKMAEVKVQVEVVEEEEEVEEVKEEEEEVE